MKDKLEKIYNILDNKFYFRLFYLFVSLALVTILKVIPGINILSKVALVWGILLILFMIFPPNLLIVHQHHQNYPHSLEVLNRLLLNHSRYSYNQTEL